MMEDKKESKRPLKELQQVILDFSFQGLRISRDVLNLLLKKRLYVFQGIHDHPQSFLKRQENFFKASPSFGESHIERGRVAPVKRRKCEPDFFVSFSHSFTTSDPSFKMAYLMEEAQLPGLLVSSEKAIYFLELWMELKTDSIELKEQIFLLEKKIPKDFREKILELTPQETLSTLDEFVSLYIKITEQIGASFLAHLLLTDIVKELVSNTDHDWKKIAAFISLSYPVEHFSFNFNEMTFKY